MLATYCYIIFQSIEYLYIKRSCVHRTGQPGIDIETKVLQHIKIIIRYPVWCCSIDSCALNTSSYKVQNNHNHRNTFFYIRRTKVLKHKCFFAQFIESRCWIDNKDGVGAAPTDDAPTISQWSKSVLYTNSHISLEVWRYFILNLSPPVPWYNHRGRTIHYIWNMGIDFVLPIS